MAAITNKQERADAVLERIKTGESLRQSAREEGFDAATFLDWCRADDQLAKRYARAKEIGCQLLADELVAIADETQVTAKVDGDEVTLALDPVAVARNRLRVDTRKWVLSKLLPKVYGEKMTLAGDEENPVRTVSRVERVIRKAE